MREQNQRLDTGFLHGNTQSHAEVLRDISLAAYSADALHIDRSRRPAVAEQAREGGLSRKGDGALNDFFNGQLSLTNKLYAVDGQPAAQSGKDKPAARPAAGEDHSREWILRPELDLKKNTGWVPPEVVPGKDKLGEHDASGKGRKGEHDASLKDKKDASDKGKGGTGDKSPDKPVTYAEVDAALHKVEGDNLGIDNANMRQRDWQEEQKIDEKELNKDREQLEDDRADVKAAREILKMDGCDADEIKHALQEQKLGHQQELNNAKVDALAAENRRLSGVTMEDLGKSRSEDGEKALQEAAKARKLEEEHRKMSERYLKEGDYDKAMHCLKMAQEQHEIADKKQLNGDKWKLEGESLQAMGKNEQKEAERLKKEAEERKARAEKMLALDDKMLGKSGLADDWKSLQRQVVALERQDARQSKKEVRDGKKEIEADEMQSTFWALSAAFRTLIRDQHQKEYEDLKRRYESQVA